MTMTNPHNQIDKQACVCARLNHTIDQVRAIARARNWRGALRQELERRFETYQRPSVVAHNAKLHATYQASL